MVALPKVGGLHVAQVAGVLHGPPLTLRIVKRSDPDAASADRLRHLQRAGRDQHRHGHRRHGARGGGDGRPSAGGGLRRFGCAGVLARATQGQPGGATARDGKAQADPAPRPYRCRRREARGLVARSLQAHRAGRLLLRPRHDRQQVHGDSLRRQPDPLQAGGLHARARHHRGAGGGRGDRRRHGGRHPLATGATTGLSSTPSSP